MARRARLVTSSGFLLALLALALCAPWITASDPNRVVLGERLAPPMTPGHPLGADVLGRDIWARLLWGGRISLGIAVVVVAIGATAGTLAGTVAGYRRGILDELLMRVVDVLLAFPGILFAIILVGLLGPGVPNVVVALSLTGWVSYARLARGQTLRAREMQYVEAARALGASFPRVVLRHLLPNIAGPILVQATLGMAGVMLAESALSFLGVGTPAPLASWGGMLNEGRAHLFDAPHLTVIPGLVLALAVLAFNQLGDALRDLLDPRAEGR
jgi:peptide/nickel transport system permease protein